MQDIDLSPYGAHFAKIRTLTKELETLGVQGLETQLPSVAMDTMEDALDIIVKNLTVIRSCFISDIEG